MKFQYKSVNTPTPLLHDNYCIRHLPILEVGFEINGISRDMGAIVDSGAEINMMPLALAPVFGVNLVAFPITRLSGIEGKGIESRIVPCKIKIDNNHEFNTSIAIGGNPGVILLGQRGFFNLFKKVSFEYPKWIEFGLFK